jgi:AcrR family transcriptional regulator
VDVAETEPRQRADARRNRQRILDAAASAFAEGGLDVPLETVAERAGVGIGTLYRHFATREDLVAGCFLGRLDAHVRAAEDALTAPDGWTGFRQYVESTCGLQAADRGLNDLLTRTFPPGYALEPSRRRAYELAVRILDRAKAEGTVRDDAVPEDYAMLLMGNAGVVAGMGTDAPEAWRRYVALILEALRARPDNRELPSPPTPGQVLRTTLRLGRGRARAGDKEPSRPVRGDA